MTGCGPKSNRAAITLGAWCALLWALAVPAPAALEQGVRNAIVKIYAVHNRPNYYNPSTMYGPRQSSGSGAIISGRRILTNAHVVEDQTFLQVRRNGNARRYRAEVLAVSHEADLALLRVEDASFFAGVTPLDFGGLPNTQEEVLVYGFPLGGDSLSITKGVISRIEHQTYAHSSCRFLAAQIDAAINPGNSGGPVLRGGRIVGVVMQSMSKAENIGYMVPMPIIEHFLLDVEDGVYHNFPSMGVVLQTMENPSLKSRFGLPPEQTGVLVVRVLLGSPADGALEVGDVVLSVDDHVVADDGTIEFRPGQRTRISYLVQQRQVGEPIDVEMLRRGERRRLTLTLHRSLREDWLIPMEVYDVLPSYFIYGGVVFCPLSKNLLREWGANWYNSAPKNFVAMLDDNYRTAERDEVVLILKVLAADVNEGYHEVSNWVVQSVNGARVRHLAHAVRLIESSQGPYVEIENANGQVVVLDRQRVANQQADILERYRIASDRSPDLPPPVPPTAPAAGEIVD